MLGAFSLLSAGTEDVRSVFLEPLREGERISQGDAHFLAYDARAQFHGLELKTRNELRGDHLAFIFIAIKGKMDGCRRGDQKSGGHGNGS